MDLLRNLNLDKLIPNLPGDYDDRLRGIVAKAVDIVDPAAPSPEPPPVVVPPGVEKSEVLEAIDTAIATLGVLLKLRSLIPNQFEPVLDLLVKGLQLARTWFD